MKKLLILLLSLFLLSSPSVFADDISDFEIEGITIGDSLLDYMSEDEILEGIKFTKNHYSYLNEPNKYSEVYLIKDFPTYKSGLSFFIENNASNQYITNKNEKFRILFIRGKIDYVEDFDSCIAKRNEIEEVLSKMFPNTEKTELVQAHSLDPSGNSIINNISFFFKTGDKVRLVCSNWEETFRIQNNFTEGLSIAIQPKKITEWLTDY